MSFHENKTTLYCFQHMQIFSCHSKARNRWSAERLYFAQRRAFCNCCLRSTCGCVCVLNGFFWKLTGVPDNNHVWWGVWFVTSPTHQCNARSVSDPIRTFARHDWRCADSIHAARSSLKRVVCEVRVDTGQGRPGYSEIFHAHALGRGPGRLGSHAHAPEEGPSKTMGTEPAHEA